MPETPPGGPGCEPLPRALVTSVIPGSPADDAGFTPGCYVTSVDGQPVRDLIDWRWLASDDEIALGYVDADGEEGICELWREEGEGWGFEFDGVVFDRVRQCRNACSFCFMRQLPDDARSSLTLRDDDFRLSFLCGTFVTFTNLRPEDERRIVEQAISPLRFSLHVADPDIRRTMIGRHAQHGIDALERLLAQGIQVHAQIVLVPGENDGEVLWDTLEWAYARPGILDVCVVPLRLHEAPGLFLPKLRRGALRSGRARAAEALSAARARAAGDALGLRSRRVLPERLRKPRARGAAASCLLRRLRDVRGRRGHRAHLRRRLEKGVRKGRRPGVSPGCGSVWDQGALRGGRGHAPVLRRPGARLAGGRAPASRCTWRTATSAATST